MTILRPWPQIVSLSYGATVRSMRDHKKKIALLSPEMQDINERLSETLREMKQEEYNRSTYER